MSEFVSLSKDHQELLKMAPIWVFLVVSGADGTIDEKEYKQFEKDIQGLSEQLEPGINGIDIHHGFVYDIFAALSCEFTKVRTEIESQSSTPLEGLKRLSSEIKLMMDEDEAKIYKKVLENIAYNIAECSGSWNLINRSISKPEALAIKELKTVLNFSK